MRIRDKPLPRISHCVQTHKGDPGGSLLWQIKQCLLSPAAECDSAIIRRDPWKGGGRSQGLKAEWRAAGIIYSQLPFVPPSPPSAEPLSLSPDSSINHSVTKTLTQSACNAPRRKRERGEGFCCTADKPHLLVSTVTEIRKIHETVNALSFF